jgi:signal transduction histidine kinase
LRPEKLNPIITDVLELLQPQIARNNIDLRVSLDEQAGLAMLDESSIRGALMNLMINAVDAMLHGGVLTITSARTAETLEVRISDTGRGIAEQELKNIFEPFYTTKEQGLGLGMPYANKIIEQHGGSITVDSKLGEGTTIRVTLPAAQQKAQENANDVD